MKALAIAIMALATVVYVLYEAAKVLNEADDQSESDLRNEVWS